MEPQSLQSDGLKMVQMRKICVFGAIVVSYVISGPQNAGISDFVCEELVVSSIGIGARGWGIVPHF